MAEEKDVKAVMRDAYAYGTGFMLDGKHVPAEEVLMSSEEIAVEQAAKSPPMTPDIREKAGRLNAAASNAETRVELLDLLSQALLEAHNAGRAEMKEEAAAYVAGVRDWNGAEHYCDSCKNGYSQPDAEDIATAIRSIT